MFDRKTNKRKPVTPIIPQNGKFFDKNELLVEEEIKNMDGNFDFRVKSTFKKRLN